MNIRHLKIFIEVAQSGKMSLAATKFFISQPSVSQVIRELEKHYNTKLFERISQKLYITHAGKILLEKATDIVNRYEALEREMTHLSKGESFRIGFTPYIDHPIFAEVLDSLNFRCPDIDFSVVSASDQTIEQKLLSFDIDVGIMSGRPKNNDLVAIPLIKDYLVLICPKQHPLYEKEVLTPLDFDGQYFAIHEEGSYIRFMFDTLIHEHPISVHKKWESSDVNVLKKSVINRGCLLLSSAMAFSEEILSGEVHAYLIDDDRKDFSVHLVYPKQKEVSKGIKTLSYIFEHLDINELPPEHYYKKFK